MLSKLFRHIRKRSRASPSIFYPLVLLLGMTASVEVFALTLNFTTVDAGTYHTCGMTTDGSVFCWGLNNDYGQSTPPSGTFTQVSAGSAHTCGVKTDGSLACWGHDGYSQSTPPSGSFTQVSAGGIHTCGVKTDGSLACWGYDGNGRTTPPSGTFTQVSAGAYHTCGVKTDGSVACWGSNSYRQSTPPSGTFTQLSGGLYHTCGVKTDGSVACWGYNDDGRSTPPSGTFTQVGAGAAHSCGVKTDGSVACWGYNDDGRSTPPSGTFTQLSVGFAHTCGMKTNGSVVCWGDNQYGQSTPPSMVSPTLGTKPLTVTLNADSVVGSSMLNYQWYANNQFINAGNPSSYTFTGHGEYVIKLVATHNDGSTSEAQQNVRVMSHPVAKFTVSPLSGNTVKLDASGSHDPDGSIVSYQWAVNGKTIIGMMVTTTLNSGDKVTLTITDNEGLTASSDTPNEDLAPTLTVTKSGTGNGRVSGQGIYCGSDCTEQYDVGNQVTLTTEPETGSTFEGWGGACSGTGDCVLTINAVKNVTATFKRCDYSISPTHYAHGFSADTGEVKVNTSPGCAWTARSNDIQANITSGGVGKGEGTVIYEVTTNPTLKSRQGTLTIAEQTFTLTQPAGQCTFNITPASHSHTGYAETGRITVTALEGCQWMAHSNNPWITITGGLNGQGTGTVTYAITTNISTQNRQGTLTISDTLTEQTYTVNQAIPGNTPPTPVVTVTPSQGKPPLTVTADGRESSDKEGIIETYAWTTSDGQTASTPKTSFTFTKEGNYDITLVVTDEGNFSDSETKTVTVSSATTYLSNLSTRARIQGGSGDIIAGFGIRGKETQRILLRGISLEPGVDPELVLQNYSTQEVLGKNNNWEQDSRHTEIPRGMRPDNETDAALLRDLPKGYYTVQLSSKGAKALGIVEVIRLSKTPPVNKLFNISTRALVQGGAYDIIAGFIIEGEGLQKVVIRGTAVDTGVDPVLIVQELGKTEVMAQNDNWLDDPRASEIPAHLQLTKKTDAALLLSLPEGKYTVILTSLGAKKLGLIEVVAVD